MSFYYCYKPAMEAQPGCKLPVPFKKKICGGLMCRTINIRGFIPCSAYSFAISFSVENTRDIALHIKSYINRCAVVRNTFQNCCWGCEESCISYNPFVPGQYFDLSIQVSNCNFTVFANGRHFFDYNHRMSPCLVDTLEICGDVDLSCVQV
ncbi:galectin-4-like [Sorex fumeus]|uniref:galectin-4-like n=1 Tax=Sorex fumeus TaxID=62283 RepID=UPI0024ACAD8F|nr:galectin-4-like [Sorex fumeus]